MVYRTSAAWNGILDDILDFRKVLSLPIHDPFDDGDTVSHKSNDGPCSSAFLGRSGNMTDLTMLSHILPNKEVCDQCVTFYMEVFSPLLHILHEPSFYEEYKTFWENPRDFQLSWLALLYTILALSVLCIPRDHILMVELSKSGMIPPLELVETFQKAAQTCLFADNFLQHYRLSTLQAVILLIYSYNHTQGVHDGWWLLGIGHHIAIGLGCHRDGSHFGFGLLVTEIRRRVWAALLNLDCIFVTMSGRPSLINPAQYDTKLPLNVDDCDITPETTVASPIAQSRPTQMTYLLCKFRLYAISRQIFEEAHHLSVPETSRIRELDTALQKVPSQWPYLGTSIESPGAEWAQLLILQSYVHQLCISLHKKFLLDRSLELNSFSRQRVASSAVALLRIHKDFCDNPALKRYGWYTNGLGTFQALHAAISLTIEIHLLSTNDDGNESRSDDMTSMVTLYTDVLDSAQDSFNASAGSSTMAEKAAIVLQEARTTILVQGCDPCGDPATYQTATSHQEYTTTDQDLSQWLEQFGQGDQTMSFLADFNPHATVSATENGGFC